jgi:hypothetical protein
VVRRVLWVVVAERPVGDSYLGRVGQRVVGLDLARRGIGVHFGEGHEHGANNHDDLPRAR